MCAPTELWARHLYQRVLTREFRAKCLRSCRPRGLPGLRRCTLGSREARQGDRAQGPRVARARSGSALHEGRDNENRSSHEVRKTLFTMPQRRVRGDTASESLALIRASESILRQYAPQIAQLRANFFNRLNCCEERTPRRLTQQCNRHRDTHAANHELQSTCERNHCAAVVSCIDVLVSNKSNDDARMKSRQRVRCREAASKCCTPASSALVTHRQSRFFFFVL
jgi:hypothetical protein